MNFAVENETARSTRTVAVQAGKRAVEPTLGQPPRPPSAVQLSGLHQSPSDTSAFHRYVTASLRVTPRTGASFVNARPPSATATCRRRIATVSPIWSAEKGATACAPAERYDASVHVAWFVSVAASGPTQSSSRCDASAAVPATT